MKERFKNLGKRQKVAMIAVFLLFLIAFLTILLSPKKPISQKTPQTSSPLPILNQFSSSVFGPVLRLVKRENTQVKLVPSLQPSVPASSPSVPSPTTVPYNIVLDKTLNFIKSLYRPDGYYNYYPDYERICPPDKKKEECPFSGVQMFETTNAWTALAYLAAFKMDPKPEYLKQVTRDLDKLTEYCQKDMKNCLWVLVQFAEAYKVTKDPQYLSLLKLTGEVLLTTSDDNAMLKNIEARELAIIGEITGDERYIKEAEKRFVEAKNLKPEKQFYLVIDENAKDGYLTLSSCWHALAGSQLYSRKGKEKELGNIETFLDKINPEGNFEAYISPITIQPCIESYFILASAKNNKLYKDKAKKLTDSFIQQFWGESNGYSGQGVVFPYQKKHRAQRNTVELAVVTDSCYLIHLLSLISP